MEKAVEKYVENYPGCKRCRVADFIDVFVFVFDFVVVAVADTVAVADVVVVTIVGMVCIAPYAFAWCCIQSS